jgi:hypothetical protein
MKKVLALGVVLALLLGAIPALAEGELATGLALVASLSSSKPAAEDADGVAQTDASVVAVTLDGEGRIVDCIIDAIQTRITFSAEGQLTTDPAAQFATKTELGEGYGMKAASAIQKEWYEQAAALADYVKGKTLEEVLAIATGESGAATDADLVASVTIRLDSYLAAIAQAVQNAQALGAGAGDALHLAVTTDIARSTGATADGPGSAQSYSFITAVTTDDQGVITSCIIDSLQGNVSFDAAGAITSDTASPVQSKNALGEAYGMKGASALGKEWNEQAAGFAEYVKGKTAEQVAGINLDDSGKAADADLLSAATVTVSPMVQVVLKAIQG